MRYGLSLLFLMAWMEASAQIDTSKSKVGTYFFDREDLVFEFDRQAYATLAHSADSLSADFADLGILDAIDGGHVKHWSKDGWTLRKIDANRYQLRKKLQDLKDAPNWLFKLLIYSDYWSLPDSVFVQQGWLGRYEIKTDSLPTPVDTGQVTFHLNGYLQNKVVILTGTFNNWDEHAYQMKRDATGWTLHLSLAPQEYEYKFIVDGEWMHDPANPDKRVNQFGTYNSVLRLSTLIHFTLAGFPQAQTVILTGSFNNWDKHALAMHRTDTGWALAIPLSSGKHTYKFIVDGQWMTDPANPLTEQDWKSNENSVLFVR